MKFGSVCSGIEAASVAWEPLGWTAAWFSEIEPFPSAVLAHHYPAVPNLGDMTTIARRVLSGEVEAPDLLCGGTPCQAFSVAGLRKSLDDERGNLSLKFVELANAIDHVRTRAGHPPAIVFWENVPGVLNTKDNAFGCFLAGLAGEDDPLQPPGGKWTNAGAVFGPQRAVAWRVLDAQYFGLAQRRKRVFVVASARNDFDPAAVLFEFDGVRRDTAPSRETGQGIAACTGAGTAVGFQSSQSGVRLVDAHATLDANNGPRRHNGVITMAHGQGGAEIGFDRGPTLTCNHEAPIAAYAVRTANTSANGHGISPEMAHTRDQAQGQAVVQQVTHSLRGEGFDASEDGTGRGTPLVPVGIFQDSEYGVAQYDSAGTLRAGRIPEHQMVMQPVAFHPTQDPISSTDGTTHAMGCGSSGGAATVAVAVALRGRDGGATAELGDEVGHALRASSGGGDKPHILTAMQVRRLTPVECERLQGFPDDYTAIPWRNKPASECPDGPRYKALGNSWAVPNVRWIGQRIEAAVRGRA